MYVETMAYCLEVARELGVVTYTCHPSLLEDDEGGFQIGDWNA